MTSRATKLVSALTKRVLLRCGVVGPVLFVSTDLVAGVMVEDYDPLRHSVSSLVLSEIGWVQVTNFLVTGALFLAFARGLGPLRQQKEGVTRTPLMVVLVGIGLIGSGIFPTDPVPGYPPGTPMVVDRTLIGAIHTAFGIPVFLGLLGTCIDVARRFAKAKRRAWAIYSGVVAVALVAGLVLLNLGFSQGRWVVPVGGLLQRITLIVGLTCVATLAWYRLRRRESR